MIQLGNVWLRDGSNIAVITFNVNTDTACHLHQHLNGQNLQRKIGAYDAYCVKCDSLHTKDQILLRKAL